MAQTTAISWTDLTWGPVHGGPWTEAVMRSWSPNAALARALVLERRRPGTAPSEWERVDPEPREEPAALAGPPDEWLFDAGLPTDPNGCGDPECHPGCRNYPGPRPQDGGEQ